MITILNRTELCITMSMRAQSEIRSLLQHKQIDYKIKVVDESINRTGSTQYALPRGKATIIYTFYVAKKDYDYAKSCINSIRLQDESI